MQCVVLAGGLGSRMAPLTDALPKSMIPVLGRPFIDHQLDWLARQGIRDVVLAIGHLGTNIRDFVGDGRKWAVTVRYVEDGENLLGTAGALRRVIDRQLLADGFFVLYGDSYLQTSFRDVWAASGQGQFPLMTVFRNDNAWDDSNVLLSDGEIALFEKGRIDARSLGMRHIDYGLSVLTAATITEWVVPGVPADLANLFHELSIQRKLRAFEVFDRFYEIGSPQGLADFEEYLANEDKHGV